MFVQKANELAKHALKYIVTRMKLEGDQNWQLCDPDDIEAESGAGNLPRLSAQFDAYELSLGADDTLRVDMMNIDSGSQNDMVCITARNAWDFVYFLCAIADRMEEAAGSMEGSVLGTDEMTVLTVDLPTNKEVADWFEEHAEPTYRDTILKEHLYGVSIEDDEDEDFEVPEFIRTFIAQVELQCPEAAYVRFA